MKRLLLVALVLLVPSVARAITYQSVRASTSTTLNPGLQVGTMNISSATVTNLRATSLGVSNLAVSTISATSLSATSISATSGSFTSLSGSTITYSSATFTGANIQSGTFAGTVTGTVTGPVSNTSVTTSTLTVTSSATLSATSVTGTLAATGSSNLTGAVTLGSAGNAVTISSNAVLSGSTFYAGGAPAVLGPVRFSSAPFSNWTSYTPSTSGGFGTKSNTSCRWRRVGDSMEVKCYWQCGTTAATVSSATIPSPYTIDTNNISSTASTSQLGTWYGIDNAGFGTGNFFGPVFADGTNNQVIFFAGAASTSAFIKANGNAMCGSNQGVTFNATIPILDWSF